MRCSKLNFLHLSRDAWIDIRHLGTAAFSAFFSSIFNGSNRKKCVLVNVNDPDRKCESIKMHRRINRKPVKSAAVVTSHCTKRFTPFVIALIEWLCDCLYGTVIENEFHNIVKSMVRFNFMVRLLHYESEIRELTNILFEMKCILYWMQWYGCRFKRQRDNISSNLLHHSPILKYNIDLIQRVIKIVRWLGSTRFFFFFLVQ